jgi:hypothetical protein
MKEAGTIASRSFSRLCHFTILRRATILLVTMAWSIFAICGEIRDAAAAGFAVRGL